MIKNPKELANRYAFDFHGALLQCVCDGRDLHVTLTERKRAGPRHNQFKRVCARLDAIMVEQVLMSWHEVSVDARRIVLAAKVLMPNAQDQKRAVSYA